MDVKLQYMFSFDPFFYSNNLHQHVIYPNKLRLFFIFIFILVLVHYGLLFHMDKFMSE